jgi:hypothetical protein
MVKKKTKPLVSPNYIAVLAIEEDTEIELDTSCDVPNVNNESIVHHQHDNIRTLLIYVQNINNFCAFENMFLQIIDPKGFGCKSSSSFFIVRLRGRLNFNTITKHQMTTSACFQSFTSS